VNLCSFAEKIVVVCSGTFARFYYLKQLALTPDWWFPGNQACT
jgi:hypothetical protein